MTPIRCLNGIPALARPAPTQEKQIRAAQRGEISCLHPSADAHSNRVSDHAVLPIGRTSLDGTISSDETLCHHRSPTASVKEASRSSFGRGMGSVSVDEFVGQAAARKRSFCGSLQELRPLRRVDEIVRLNASSSAGPIARRVVTFHADKNAPSPCRVWRHYCSSATAR